MKEKPHEGHRRTKNVRPLNRPVAEPIAVVSDPQIRHASAPPSGRSSVALVGAPLGPSLGIVAARAASTRTVSHVSAFVDTFLEAAISIIRRIDRSAVEDLAPGLAAIRERGGRLFVLGVGGSAAHAGHAAGDFRKICDLEAYSPTDNVAELTARVNDDGWESTFAEWLKGSRLDQRDAILVFSVGGGNAEKGVSVNLVRALDHARSVGAPIFGVVGRDGGYTKSVAESCVVVPTVSEERVTAHTEGICAVVWHLLVSHPALQARPMKWESIR